MKEFGHMFQKQIIVNTNFAKYESLSDCLQFLQTTPYRQCELTTDNRAHAYPFCIPELNANVILTEDFSYPVLSGGWADFIQGELQYVQNQLNFAKHIGAKSVRFFLSNPKKECPSSLELLPNTIKNIAYFTGQSVNLLFENHGGYFSNLNNVEALCWSFGATTGLVYDPANYIYDNVDPIEALLRLYPYIKHVHIKDINLNKEFVIVGEGTTPWKRILQFLKNKGYTGYLSLEYESNLHKESFSDKQSNLLKSLDNFNLLCEDL
jgi:sugar phosphate isomerase/epimerase